MIMFDSDELFKYKFEQFIKLLNVIFYVIYYLTTTFNTFKLKK